MRRLLVSVVPIAAAMALMTPGVASAYTCTTTVSNETDITNAVVAASSGDTVCVANGSYGAVLIGGSHANWVYLRPANGASVTFSSLEYSWSSHYIDVQGLTVSGIVTFDGQSWLGQKSSHVRLHHSDLGYAVQIGAGQDTATIDHNTLSNSPGDGIEVNGTSTAAVTNTRIANNLIDSPAADAILATYFDGLEIEQNEITGLDEQGAHSDAFQSYLGGEDLLFAQNYIHDFCGQGFFIKDGQVDGVQLYNNLIVRDKKTVGDCPKPINIQETTDLDIRRNTVWDNNQGSLIEGPSTSNVDVINNQLEYLDFADDSDHTSTIDTWCDSGSQISGMVDEDYNILGGGYNWSVGGCTGANDVLSRTTGFTWEDGSHTGDNYRLDDAVTYGDSSQQLTGVSWVPGDFDMGN